MFMFFFFSSRRRHTRFDCDWSSDVCSSDLFGDNRARFDSLTSAPTYRVEKSTSVTMAPPFDDPCPGEPNGETASPTCARFRSEERRVGKSVDLGGRRIIKKKKKQQSKRQRY